MRLTLRTLLAYLDDVLDPVDKEELAKKIESSEFAEDLVLKTRDTVRRLRLSAPQVIGTGMGLDPNTVAEYLDNVMSPDQVGDFERICLESDVHLAEVTACHHVLTMVLGAPAEVDPITRQRMYTIATDASGDRQHRIEAAHVPSAAIAPAAKPQPISAPPANAMQARALEIPEYLRARPWWRSTAFVGGLAALVFIGTAIVFFSGLGGWFGGKSDGLDGLTAQNAAPPAVNSPAATSPAGMPPAPPADEARMGLPDVAPATTDLTQLSSPGTPAGAEVFDAASAVPTTSGNNGASVSAPPDPYATSAADTSPAQPNVAESTSAPPMPKPAGPGETATATENTAPPIATVPFATIPGEVTPPLSAPESETSPPSVAPPELASATPSPDTTGAIPNATPPDLTSPAPTDAAAPAPSAKPTIPPDSGTYLGGKTVLLRYDEKSGAWFRVEPRSAIIPGQRVLSLPEFRPKIALASGVQVDMSGGTQIVMASRGNDALPAVPAAGAEVVPALELVYGRIVLINPTATDRAVQLKLGAMSGTVKLAHNAVLAAEVARIHVLGDDPQKTPAPLEVRLFAPAGGVVWHDAAGEKVVDKPSRWLLTAAGAADIVEDAAPPEWIDSEPIVQLSEQRYGAPVIESTLVSNVPVDTQLLELFQGSSRKEVKSLVARSAMYVGLFTPFVDALRDSEQKANWKTHIDTLRMAMALGPESAQKVYQALVDQRGKPAAADLYEMLCGYNADQVGRTPEQMKEGAVVKLINWLEDDSLDYRVLACQDLWEITGKRLMPNPAASLTERKQNVKVWRSRLDSGQLMKPAGATTKAGE